MYSTATQLLTPWDPNDDIDASGAGQPKTSRSVAASVRSISARSVSATSSDGTASSHRAAQRKDERGGNAVSSDGTASEPTVCLRRVKAQLERAIVDGSGGTDWCERPNSDDPQFAIISERMANAALEQCPAPSQTVPSVISLLEDCLCESASSSAVGQPQKSKLQLLADSETHGLSLAAPASSSSDSYDASVALVRSQQVRPSALTTFLLFHQFESAQRSRLLLEESTWRGDAQWQFHRSLQSQSKRSTELIALRAERAVANAERLRREEQARHREALVALENEHRVALSALSRDAMAVSVDHWLCSDATAALVRADRRRAQTEIAAAERRNRHHIISERDSEFLLLLHAYLVQQQQQQHQVVIEYGEGVPPPRSHHARCASTASDAPLSVSVDSAARQRALSAIDSARRTAEQSSFEGVRTVREAMTTLDALLCAKVQPSAGALRRCGGGGGSDASVQTDAQTSPPEEQAAVRAERSGNDTISSVVGENIPTAMRNDSNHASKPLLRRQEVARVGSKKVSDRPVATQQRPPLRRQKVLSSLSNTRTSSSSKIRIAQRLSSPQQVDGDARRLQPRLSRGPTPDHPESIHAYSYTTVSSEEDTAASDGDAQQSHPTDDDAVHRAEMVFDEILNVHPLLHVGTYSTAAAGSPRQDAPASPPDAPKLESLIAAHLFYEPAAPAVACSVFPDVPAADVLTDTSRNNGVPSEATFVHKPLSRSVSNVSAQRTPSMLTGHQHSDGASTSPVRGVFVPQPVADEVGTSPLQSVSPDAAASLRIEHNGAVSEEVLSSSLRSPPSLRRSASGRRAQHHGSEDDDAQDSDVQTIELRAWGEAHKEWRGTRSGDPGTRHERAGGRVVLPRDATPTSAGITPNTKRFLDQILRPTASDESRRPLPAASPVATPWRPSQQPGSCAPEAHDEPREHASGVDASGHKFLLRWRPEVCGETSIVSDVLHHVATQRSQTARLLRYRKSPTIFGWVLLREDDLEPTSGSPRRCSSGAAPSLRRQNSSATGSGSWQRRYAFLNESGTLSLVAAGSAAVREQSFRGKLSSLQEDESGDRHIKWEALFCMEDVVRLSEHRVGGSASASSPPSRSSSFNSSGGVAASTTRHGAVPSSAPPLLPAEYAKLSNYQFFIDVAHHVGPKLSDVCLRRVRFCCFTSKDYSSWTTKFAQVHDVIRSLVLEGRLEPSPLIKFLSATQPDTIALH